VRSNGFGGRPGSLSRLGRQVDINGVFSIYLNVKELRAKPFVEVFPSKPCFLSASPKCSDHSVKVLQGGQCKCSEG
jgi:hypothetical protein